MKYIFIVTWCLISQTLDTNLPTHITQYDELGREIYKIPLMVSDTVYHSKQFQDRDSAETFYFYVLNESNRFSWNNEAVGCAEIDSAIIRLEDRK